MLALLAGPAWAHGDASALPSWRQGFVSLFGDAPSLLALLGLVLLLAQPDQRLGRPVRWGAIAGAALGCAAAAAGLVADLSVPLLALVLLTGAGVALARPWPAAALGVLTATVLALVWPMLMPMLMPDAPAATAASADEWATLRFRLSWLAGVVLGTALVTGVGMAAVRLALGPHPGPVRRLLLRVAGAWAATAALLALALSLSGRSA